MKNHLQTHYRTLFFAPEKQHTIYVQSSISFSPTFVVAVHKIAMRTFDIIPGIATSDRLQERSANEREDGTDHHEDDTLYKTLKTIALKT